MKPIDVNPKDLDVVLRILSQHVPEHEVRVFGSRVAWTARETSDLDLALMTDEPLDALRMADLKEAFTESVLPFKVDLVDWAVTKEGFQQIIGKEYIVVQKAARGEACTGGELGGEWRETTLGELADFLSGGTPSKSNARYWGGSIPWVSAKDMKRPFLDDTEKHLTEEGLSNGTKLVPEKTVLLLTRGMTLLNDVPICVVRRPMAFNRDVKALRPQPALDEDFFPYLLLGHKHRLLSLVDLAGHGTGRLNTDELKTVDVLLPPSQEQRAIAHILGTLDDKIELNRRMSETLEAMARALFKSWFVDFDPVRAKAQGRDPGLPNPLADLFPARLVNSELGEIPEGWEVGMLGNAFTVTMGQSPPGSTYNEIGEGLPFYQGRADFTSRFPNRRVYCTAPTRLAEAEDTLISVRAPVGDINMASEDCAIGRGVAAARHNTGSRSYTYQFMRGRKDVFDRFEAEGTVFGSIGKKDFHAIPCVIAPDTVIAAFDRLCSPVDGQIESRDRESRTLAALRDTLLPKLISGELRVKDAKRFVAEAPI